MAGEPNGAPDRAGAGAEPVVIVGSGLAGYNTAREFRKRDKHTPLVIVSRDAAAFYSKPMLSNALAGNKTAAALVMKPAQKMAEELDAAIWHDTVVERIDTGARTLASADGRSLVYRDLVLALGADPIRLPLQGDGADAVLSVNDLGDYARFAQALEGVSSVAILGAGLIGCEFANDLLARGIRSTVIDLADRPLARLLPEAASLHLRDRLAAAGVTFCFGVGVERIDRSGAGFSLQLSDARIVQAGLVLSAIGLRPRTALAQAAGITVARGVVTDALLATSAAHVHAVGDCAEVAGHNLPYVLPLMQQARSLGATLAGVPTPVSYPAMPVTVKTPACPTVVCPPAPDARGDWSVDLQPDACCARFLDADGRLLGFALLGTATAQRQALAALVPPLLGGA